MEKVDYLLMARQLSSLIEEDGDCLPVLSNCSALLWENLKDINWAGFYLVRGDVLVLGPFQGKLACIHIEKGKGVCGTAWETDSTQLVANVHEFPGHIACDSASRSEIVIPLHAAEQVVAVLDIDSPVPDRFSGKDREGLEQLVQLFQEKLGGLEQKE